MPDACCYERFRLILWNNNTFLTKRNQVPHWYDVQVIRRGGNDDDQSVYAWTIITTG